MSAYNWLSANVVCYKCNQVSSRTLQVPIAWCKYHRYVLGDELIWMNQEEREQANNFPLARTAVEIGSSGWENFLISVGIFECPNCSTESTIMISIKNNIFFAVETIESKIPYGKIVFPET